MRKYLGRPLFLILAMLVLLAAGTWVLTGASLASSPSYGGGEDLSVFKSVSLLNASPQQVKQAALDYTHARIHVKSGTPEVVLSQSFANKDLYTIGLSEIGSNQPDVAVVVVKGDFDITGAWPGSSLGDTSRKYMTYVFERETGKPVEMIATNDDRYVQNALHPDKSNAKAALPPNVLPPLVPAPKANVTLTPST